MKLPVLSSSFMSFPSLFGRPSTLKSLFFLTPPPVKPDHTGATITLPLPSVDPASVSIKLVGSRTITVTAPQVHHKFSLPFPVFDVSQIVVNNVFGLLKIRVTNKS